MARFHILVAVSGGADSVALLHLLHGIAKGLRWRLTVAHLDHGIRGAAARGDAEFVARLARRLRLPCVEGRTRVPVLARRQGLSLEMAARQARYAFLVRTARKVKADAIATAHTADDQAETILLKWLRGAGRGGLSGMEPVATVEGIPLVRPLLDATRREIESFLRERGIAWREDESNRDPAFLRNRVRHELLPLLERDYNPGLRATLLRAADVMAGEDAWLDDLARGILKDCAAGKVLSTRLRDFPLAARRRVFRLWLAQQGVPVASLDFEGIARVDALLGRSRGSQSADLPGGWRVERRYDQLAVVHGIAAVPEVLAVPAVPLKIPGVTLVPSLNLRVTATFAPGVVRERGAGPGRLPARATVSAGVLGKRKLYVRSVRPGDRMAPYGMKGTRKVQDILVDAKVPRSDRARVPVLVCAGRIVWLPGYRIDRAWAAATPSAMNLQLGITGYPSPRPAPSRGEGTASPRGRN